MALDGGSPSGGTFDDEAASDAVRTQLSSLTTNGGTWINWSRLVSVAVGFLSTVWFSRLAELVGSFFELFAIGPVVAVGDVLGDVASALLGAIPASIRGSFQPATEFVRDLGPSAFAIGVLIVVVISYVVARGLNRDG